MTTFIFMLTPDATDDAFAHVEAKLQSAFPEHTFLSNLEEFADIENNIMAVSDPAHVDGYVGAIRMPDEREVERVKRAFFELIGR